MPRNIFCASLLILLLSNFTFADQFLQKDLDRFKSDSKTFMNSVPRKDGAALVKHKEKTQSELKILSEIQDNDSPEDIIEPTDQSGQPLPIISIPSEMESAQLMSASLIQQPWSSSYFPTYQGGLATRYSAPGFPMQSKDWKDYQNFSSQQVDPDNLSPAEKYDLLIGDQNQSLTKLMWEEGNYYYTKNGKVDDWIGICDGWSLAAIGIARPLHKVVLNSITFYPSDIKALLARLNAKGIRHFRMIGAKCGQKNPPQDANGRVTDQNCFDTNPGTWHQVLVNQIARQAGLIIDASNDDQVWNQPVYKYAYQYFNPGTLQAAHTLAEATIPLASFFTDKFKTYRSPKAVSVVGVGMDLTYLDETNASHQATDSPAFDLLTTVHYVYDLELNSKNEIIGGEWYQNRHPDFLWTAPRSSHTTTTADGQIQEDWDGTGTMPINWQSAAKNASQRGQPLSHIVDLLVQLSQ